MLKCPKCAYENKDEVCSCRVCAEVLKKPEINELSVKKASHMGNKIFSEKFWETIVHSKLFF